MGQYTEVVIMWWNVSSSTQSCHMPLNIWLKEIKMMKGKQTLLLTKAVVLKNLRITQICNTTLAFYTPVFRRDVLWYGDVCPSVHPSGSPSVSHSFPHFSPTCFDILSWNFAFHFLLMNIRSSSSVVNFRPFLLELCPFSNLKYWKYTVFRSFLLHALT